MALPNIFTPEVSEAVIARIEKLHADGKPEWGSMDAAKMLAHCNVTYEMAYENTHPKPGAFVRWMLKMFVKNTVVNETPYKQNSRTAPQFLIKSDKNFEVEKKRLIDYIRHTTQLGAAHFDGRESHSFGNLSSSEWNNMFYKHLDHHLRQFGV
ncbi:MAG: DUF1569 domain-containing protein [Bacteroidota bacterium]|nr:MAG: DUF1569 domain-containing protein [Bacteroidota bacterium]